MDLNVEVTGSELNIVCKDDGKGFDKTNLAINEGIGMRSMKNRTEMMGGKMQIDSKINKGTILTFHIPLR
jgi:signal transduction histidine kinase